MSGGMKVESIVWHDAAKGNREQLSEEPMILCTVGAVVKETKSTVYLAHEVHYNAQFLTMTMEWTEIPKRVIKSRTVVGEISVPMVRKRRGGKPNERGRIGNPVPPGTEGHGTVQAGATVDGGQPSDRKA